MRIVSIIIVGVLLFGIVAVAGCINPFDPCENTFTDCNHSCGEGLLNSLCKEKCTYDYNQCEKG
jgi:hypothetical protein